MPAFVIGHITVKDPLRWAEYRSRVPQTLTPWSGELLLRGERRACWAGTWPHSDTVVLRFPSLEAATHWHESPAYQSLVPLRREAADVDLAVFED